jgi:hypothetical protein
MHELHSNKSYRALVEQSSRSVVEQKSRAAVEQKSRAAVELKSRAAVEQNARAAFEQKSRSPIWCRYSFWGTLTFLNLGLQVAQNKAKNPGKFNQALNWTNSNQSIISEETRATRFTYEKYIYVTI